MDSYNPLPSQNIKLEPAWETDHVDSSAKEMAIEDQVSEMIDSNLPVRIKTELPEVDEGHPDQDEGSMDSYSLLPSHSIKLEPAYETDHVDSSAKEMAIEDQVSEMIDSNLPVRIKMELPEVYVEYADQETLACSQNVSSLPIQEPPQIEKMMFVKQELSNDLCEDKPQGFHKMTDYSSGHEIDTHSDTVSGMTMNSYEASQEHVNYCNISVNVTSLFGESTKYSLIDNGDKLQDTVETKSRDTQCLTDVCVDSHLNKQKKKYTNETSFKCDLCEAAFTQAGNLTRHKRTHTGEKPYKCSECGAAFARHHTLKKHIRLHTGDKPYKCDDCGASFIDSSDLKRHHVIHTGERPYKCDDCGASFNKSDHLKTHTQLHTGVRPHKCAECGASYLTASKLKSHMQKHTGYRPHKCDDCDLSFFQFSHLKSHRRIHTGERPYKCDDCGAAFSVRNTLNRHKKYKHGSNGERQNDKARKIDGEESSDKTEIKREG